jgi:predicted RNA binding protein YcfA (HicA-like mRNA interferase family)
MKIRDVMWEIESPRQFVHPVKPGRVPVAGMPGDDLPPGTLASIFRQAPMKKPGK